MNFSTYSHKGNSVLYSWVIAVFMLASGAAALIYQVVWARLLSLSIGSTSVAIAVVVAVFFLGLALGAWLSETATRQENTIHQYIILEAIIGISGLVLLPVLLNLDSLLVYWPEFAGHTGFKFLIVMILLGIPTTCIGATFPVMVSLLSQHDHHSRLHLGQLYSLNTAGGVLGAGLGGFVLIPQWGLDGSIYTASTLNFAIVIAGLVAFKSSVTNTGTGQKTNTFRSFTINKTLHKQSLWVLFITGMVSLACEVAWTKYLAIYTHTTIYGFAVILAVFLTGIATGAWVINLWLERLKRLHLWINGGLLILGASLILTQVGLNALPNIQAFLSNTSNGEPLGESGKYLLVFVLLFIPTLLFGALFTLNLRIASSTKESLSNPVGKAYAINTFGGIIGALGAGLWMIPKFGTSNVLNASIVIILLTSLIFFGTVSGSAETNTRDKRKQLVIPALSSALIIIIFILPPLDFRQIIRAGAYYFQLGPDSTQKAPFHYLKEGRTGVVSVTSWDGQEFEVQKDGLPESLVNPSKPFNLLAETLLGLAPWLLHPKPENAFIIGLGGATTVQALTLTDIASIRVLELEPLIPDAVRTIYGSKIPAMSDSRVELVFDDARQRLLLEDRHYDLIISQPSHPWLAGGANLFSREFFHLVRNRLTEDGIYSQWLNLFHMDAQTMKSILQAFYDEFPYGMSLIVFNESSLILLGSQTPLRLDNPTLQTRLSRPAIHNVLNSRDLHQPYDLLRYLALSRKESLQAAQGAVPATDTNLIPEVRLGRLRKIPKGAENPYQLLRKHFSLDVDAYFNKDRLTHIYQELADYFEPFDPLRAQMAKNKLKQ